MSIRMKNLVSVIVACYNGEKYIDACLEALINQTYSNIEIIICDDCSKDKSYEKLLEWQKKDNRIIVLHNDKNMYAALARNKCIENSKGTYLVIQDIDDISTEDRIEKLVEAIEENKEYSFVSSAMSVFEDNPQKPYTILQMKKEFPTKWDFLYNLPFNHPATLFKKDCILAIDGYESSKYTRRMEDFDLFMRLYAKGYKGMNVNSCLYHYRQDIDTIRRRTFASRVDEYNIRKRDFKMLHMMPYAIPFFYKPFLAHIVQKIRYRKIGKEVRNV